MPYETFELHIRPGSNQRPEAVVIRSLASDARVEFDLPVAGAVVIEPKVADHISLMHLAQLLSYLKVVRQKLGLLFRFGGPKPEFARRVLTP